MSNASLLAEVLATTLPASSRARLVASGSAPGFDWYEVSQNGWFAAAACTADQGWNQLGDLTVVDWLGRPGTSAGSSRFELVLFLAASTQAKRVALKCCLSPEVLSVSSVSSIWPGAAWMEREAFDLYGVRFLGHPDLRRILLYSEFVGHPLRKDYDKQRRQPLLRVGPLAKPRGGG